ncbi:hypothetical protein ECANGB1_1084 [Enterospora canceri]|uniref:Uncharacterized protein n=1 Tax=Enterospora canceri TaxID=1081671 RepID=A0A1Y1S820_9MICR|nr:hypothetical protein ECANGB1_1084 [Enterospora canceri]
MLDEKELSQKLMVAERLKQKSGGFMGFGKKADYVGSGMIYEEIAELVQETDAKEKYYNEAAETFAQEDNEYGLWRASECYRLLYEIFIKDDRDKAADFQMLGVDLLRRIKKYNIAGQRCVILGELYEIDQTEKALGFFKKAVEFYSEVQGYKANLKIVKLKVLLCQIILKNVTEIIGMLRENERLIDRGQLCLQMMLILNGEYKEAIDNELTRKDEKMLVDGVLNGTAEDVPALIDQFRSNNHLGVHAELMMDLFVEKYGLEQEIC